MNKLFHMIYDTKKSIEHKLDSYFFWNQNLQFKNKIQSLVCVLKNYNCHCFYFLKNYAKNQKPACTFNFLNCLKKKKRTIIGQTLHHQNTIRIVFFTVFENLLIKILFSRFNLLHTVPIPAYKVVLFHSRLEYIR